MAKIPAFIFLIDVNRNLIFDGSWWYIISIIFLSVFKYCQSELRDSLRSLQEKRKCAARYIMSRCKWDQLRHECTYRHISSLISESKINLRSNTNIMLRSYTNRSSNSDIMPLIRTKRENVRAWIITCSLIQPYLFFRSVSKVDDLSSHEEFRCV